MSKLDIHLCPETGICSVIKTDGTKIDMMPGEVDDIRNANGDAEKIKEVLSQVDPKFTDKLESTEIGQISEDLK
jgi:hypothetical protein